MRLLVAEDDTEVSALLCKTLRQDGHAVDIATAGDEAVWMAKEAAYDAILLDVNLPPPDGFAVCRELRASSVWSPVIFLTGRTEVSDRVEGLDAGGDDYLVKPFSLTELEARLRALTRRGAPARPVVLRAGDLQLDPASRRVVRGGVEIGLTPKEYLLLELLVRHQGETLSRLAIHERLWDFAFDPGSNVLDALVKRLRRKVDEPFGRSSIVTVRGVGHRFSA